MTPQWISAYLHLNRLLLLQHCKLSLATKLEREYQNKNPKFSSSFFLGCFYLTFFFKKITKEMIFVYKKNRVGAGKWEKGGEFRRERGVLLVGQYCRERIYRGSCFCDLFNLRASERERKREMFSWLAGFCWFEIKKKRKGKKRKKKKTRTKEKKKWGAGFFVCCVLWIKFCERKWKHKLEQLKTQ